MFLKKLFFIILFAIAAVSAFGVKFDALYGIALILLCLFVVASLADIVLLLLLRIDGGREIVSKLDLGEENIFSVSFKITRGWLKSAYLIDELPSEFRRTESNLPFNRQFSIFSCRYSVMPSRRGHFLLGRSLVYASCLGLFERRIILQPEGQEVDVYPAYSRLREKDEQVRSRQNLTTGNHKRQLPANKTEFRDIREYVTGDDIRTINWKASARTGHVMVNEYEDERSQHVINVIDCGTAMQRTFNSLSLQDHAINASLLVSYSALEKESDCVGICSYGPKGISFLPPRAGKPQFNSIMQQLYALDTEYGESDIEQLCLVIDRNVKRRSLIFLYTEIPTISVLERQLQFFKRISTRNCLVIVNCLDHELEGMADRYIEGKQKSRTHSLCVESTLAKDTVNQKQLIADTLQQNGIYCLSIHPESLSFGILSKYIELKAKRAW
jgi:uncharacterized protein (DUF58 family)